MKNEDIRRNLTSQTMARITRCFQVVNDQLFSSLSFVQIDAVQESFPATICISFVDTPDNNQQVNAIYQEHVNSNSILSGWVRSPTMPSPN